MPRPYDSKTPAFEGIPKNRAERICTTYLKDARYLSQLGSVHLCNASKEVRHLMRDGEIVGTAWIMKEDDSLVVSDGVEIKPYGTESEVGHDLSFLSLTHMYRRDPFNEKPAINCSLE